MTPAQYILKSWTKGAKNNLLVLGSQRNRKSTVTLRLRELMMHSQCSSIEFGGGNKCWLTEQKSAKIKRKASEDSNTVS
ncbi:unnamed protein product [Dovyalis caffra]|uniref:Uncharacterized protein n=1 Tax=Dovyalis caffra TaxID=77055 RepID=A0AAV1RMA7_9ROSI|nr:unnamed protein product [Dovyalis caffra]